MKKITKILLSLALVFSVLSFANVSVKADNTKVSGVKQTYASTNMLEVSWNEWFGTSTTESVRYHVSLYANKEKTNLVAQDETYSTSCLFSNILTQGATYYATVGVIQNDTVAFESDPVDVATRPDTPANVKFVGADASTVTITWNPTPGATSYVVTHNGIEYPVMTNTCTFPFQEGNLTYADVKAVHTTSTGFVTTSSVEATIRNISNLSVDISRDNMGLTSASSVNDNSFYIGARGSGHGFELNAVSLNGKKKISAVSEDGTAIHVNNFVRGLMYKYQVRAFVITSDGQKIYGNWSPYRYICNPKKSKYYKSAHSIRIQWGKLTKVSKVKIQVSKKRDSGFKTVAKVKPSKKSYTIRKFKKKSLKKYDTYYLRMYFYAKDAGKQHCSDVYIYTPGITLY